MVLQGRLARPVLRTVLTVLAVLVGIVLFNYCRYQVFWHPTETVEFVSDGLVIRGTLIKPDETGVFPAVVMLHGSGPDVTSDPSYRLTANTLVRNGAAVLLYDKRGVGMSDGDFEQALYKDFVNDAIAAVTYLSTRPDVDTGRIALHGNSEGGWFTAEVAHRTGQVASIFNRAGPPLPWITTVLWEARNEFLDAGVPEADLDALQAITERRWRYYIAAGNDANKVSSPERDAINARLTELRASVPVADEVLPEKVADYEASRYAAFAADYAYDPQPFLRQIDVPMQYVFGETDVNIPTAQSVEFLQAFRSSTGKDIEVYVIDDAGHSFFGFSGLLTAGFRPEYVDLLASWGARLSSDD
ncbi:MAG: alpha/beta hydrolase family protein [Woeseiaceae bacterium]